MVDKLCKLLGKHGSHQSKAYVYYISNMWSCVPDTTSPHKIENFPENSFLFFIFPSAYLKCLICILIFFDVVLIWLTPVLLRHLFLPGSTTFLFYFFLLSLTKLFSSEAVVSLYSPASDLYRVIFFALSFI